MKNLLLTLIIMVSIVSCYDDTSTTTKTISIITEPIQEDYSTMLKPIKKTQNYFLQENKTLISINYDGLEVCEIIDQDGDELKLIDFFKKDESLYFTILSHEEIENPDYDETLLPEDEGYKPEFITVEKELYYKQLDGKVTTLKTKPVKPELVNTHVNNDVFKSFETEYNGENYIDIKNVFMDSGIERNKIVNGYANVNEVGLYFYIKIGRDETIRPEGLYFWPKNRTSISKIMSKGELW